VQFLAVFKLSFMMSLLLIQKWIFQVTVATFT